MNLSMMTQLSATDPLPLRLGAKIEPTAKAPPPLPPARLVSCVGTPYAVNEGPDGQMSAGLLTPASWEVRRSDERGIEDAEIERLRSTGDDFAISRLRVRTGRF